MEPLNEILVTAPDGGPLTLVDLPAPTTRRWVIRHKAAVVSAVRQSLLSFDEACARYRLSTEEFTSWQRLIDAHGVRGLRTTKTQQYRLRRRTGCSSTLNRAR